MTQFTPNFNSYESRLRKYEEEMRDMKAMIWMKNVSICLSSHRRYSLVGHMPGNSTKDIKSEFRFHYDYITWLRSVYWKCMKVPFDLDYTFFFNLYKLSDDFLWLLHKIINFHSKCKYVIGDCPLVRQPDILSLCIVSDPWEDLESYRTNYILTGGIRREGSYWEEAYRRMYAREVCEPGGRIERWAPMPVVANEYSIQFAKSKEKDKLCAFMKVMSSKRMHSYPYFYQGGGHRINACSRTPEREYAIRHDELVIRRCKMTIKNIKKYRTKYMDLIIYEYSKLPSFLPLDVRGHIVSFSIHV